MKTFDNFYFDMISLPNLYRAYETARKGKTGKTEVLKFENNLHGNLWEIHEALLTKSYAPLPYKVFYVQDYKKRKITAPSFRDQIVHHMIFTFLEQMYESSFIYDSYACRKGKGTHKAFARLKKFLNKYEREDYFVKCDISKYFYSIDQYVLKEIISRKIKDADVLWLIEKVIDSHSEPNIPAHIKNLYFSKQRKGIPIGNLTSQLFANIYLNELDYYAKHELKIKHYVRYVDDFVFLGDDKNILIDAYFKMQMFLAERLFLKLENRKMQINKISFGVDFVGFVAFKRYTRVRTRNYRRFAEKFDEKIYLWKEGKAGYREVLSSFISYTGHLSHTNSYKVLERISSMFHKAKKFKAVKRGGNWNNGANAGVFNANLNNDPTNTNNNIGFRCCRAPWKDAVSLRRQSQSMVQFVLPSSIGMKTGAGRRQMEQTAFPAMNKEVENEI